MTRLSLLLAFMLGLAGLLGIVVIDPAGDSAVELWLRRATVVSFGALTGIITYCYLTELQTLDANREKQP